MDRITHKRLSRALLELPMHNTTAEWARLRVDTTRKPAQISMEIGPRHSNGFEECMTRELYYYWSGERGVLVMSRVIKS